MAGWPAAADTLRIATWNAGLVRDGPGLLLRDIRTGEDPQVEAAARVVAAAQPDAILLTGIDYDAGEVALRAFADRVRAAGHDLPHLFALRPNRGRMTDLDLDGDGRLRGPGDAQGWGRFSGEAGMAVLSRLPIDAAAARDFSDLLWADLPGGLSAGLPAEVLAIQRLSSTGHWDVPLILAGGGRLRLLAWHATPPVFGTGDVNARRNRDETAFWLRLLDGQLPHVPPAAPFVLLGDANLDPIDGDGRPDALLALLADPRLRDPRPESAGGRASATPGQDGDPALDTADWPEPGDDPAGPGNLRVDYVLPSADLGVVSAGVWWPDAEDEGAVDAAAASRHRLVWVDVTLP